MPNKKTSRARWGRARLAMMTAAFACAAAALTLLVALLQLLGH